MWGQGFPQPLFEGEFKVQSQRVVGEKHLKLTLRQSATDSTIHEAMRFLSTGPMPERIHAVYKLALNEYNGATTLQLIIEHWENAP